MNPILIDISMPILTSRLLIRPVKYSDSIALNQAIVESFDKLSKFMSWADHKPTIDQTIIQIKEAQVKWILRKDLLLLIFDKKNNKLLGATGFHRINWDLPKFEVGYWVRSSEANKGIITESTKALTYFAFTQLKAVRVEVRSDQNNIASQRIAQKLNFKLEGILVNDRLTNNKTLSNTVIYACTDINNLPK